jgi:hypothetical protein
MRGYGNYLDSNSLVAKLAFIILVIFVFVIVLKVGTAILEYIMSPSQDPVLLDGMIEGSSQMIIPVDPNKPDSVPILRSRNQNDGLVFTWSLWLYFKEPQFNNKFCPNDSCLPDSSTYSHIFNKGSSQPNNLGIMEPNNGPGVYVSNDYRKLAVVMNTFDQRKLDDHMVIIEDIPIEHWICLMIRMDQHRLDVFFNGVLSKSVILKEVPKQNYEDVNIALNGGFQGYISELQYFAYALGANKIQEILNNGPNLKSLDKGLNNKTADYLSFRWYFPNRAAEMQ